MNSLFYIGYTDFLKWPISLCMPSTNNDDSDDIITKQPIIPKIMKIQIEKSD